MPYTLKDQCLQYISLLGKDYWVITEPFLLMCNIVKAGL